MEVGCTYQFFCEKTILSKRKASCGGLRRGAQVLLPLAVEIPGLARALELRLRLQLLHQLRLLLHDVPRLVRAHGRLVATRLSGEAAVRVAHGALIVALEGVEVVVRARLLRVPLVVDPLLRVEAPDAAKLFRKLNPIVR